MTDTKVVAIFGIGRIGKVHFHNCFLNEHIVIKYVVESIYANAVALLKKYSVEDRVIAVCLDDVTKVYEDPE